MTDLADKRCVPCRGDEPPLDSAAAQQLLDRLDGWRIEQGRLEKTWRFPDFSSGLAFVVRVGALADAEQHHPDVFLAWGRVRLSIWTHAVGGLTENDFVLAAKIDRL